MSVQRAILAWSEADVDRWRQGDLIVPLTAEAHVALRRIPTSGLADPRTCLGRVTEIIEAATRLINTLHERLKSSPCPWLEAYPNVIFHMKVFQLFVWLRLVRGLRAKVHPLTLEVCPPVRFSGDSDVYLLAQRSFAVARDILRQEGVCFSDRCLPVPWKRWLLRRAMLLLGPPLVGMASIAPRPAVGHRRGDEHTITSASMAKGIDVALVSQQYGDSFHAAPLARRLARKLGDRFMWISRRPEITSRMTSEEADLIAGVDLHQLRFLDAALVEENSNEDYRRSMLLDLGSASAVASQLRTETQCGVRWKHWFELLLDPEFGRIAARSWSWSRLLGAFRPKVLVGLSTLQDMALVRAWARRNGVPFVELMHGVFPTVNSSYHVDADYLGVFGQLNVEAVEKSRLPQPRRVKGCGAMQFGEKARSSVRRHPERDSPQMTNAILFLGGFGWLPFCPWSPADTCRMVADIHRICCEFGRILRVRPHPRYPQNSLAPCVYELQRQHPGTIALSTEPSIQRDFDGAEFVVATGFDGAVLDALLDKRLVVSYVPEGVEAGPENAPFETMGVMAYGYEALKELFSTLLGDPARVGELRLAQATFLNDYIADLGGDPWDGALDLIGEALRDSTGTLS